LGNPKYILEILKVQRENMSYIDFSSDKAPSKYIHQLLPLIKQYKEEKRLEIARILSKTQQLNGPSSTLCASTRSG
jgi:hypothetical protein